MLQMDVKQFLELPDWKKVQLKLSNVKFNNYPIQTEEQELKRRISVLSLCSHFAMQDTFTFINSISQSTLDGLWPSAMELFVTPKSLEYIPLNILFRFGYCYCCNNFQGYNRIHYDRIIKNSNIYPMYGICALAKEDKLPSNLIRVSPQQRCVAWNPLRMYEQITDYQIKKWFQDQSKEYSYKDYKKDLETISLFDYFQNRYKAWD